MRTVLAIATLFCVCSCHHTDGGGAQSGANTAERDRVRIAVGDRLEDVSQRIVVTGGRDHSQSVGIITYPQSRWFTLKDGTCLQVVPAAFDGPGSEVVGQLIVGETGRGYENFIQWGKQRHREVPSLDL